MEAHYGKHEVPVASVPVTLLPVTKRVSLTNYVAALPLLHSVTEGRSRTIVQLLRICYIIIR